VRLQQQSSSVIANVFILAVDTCDSRCNKLSAGRAYHSEVHTQVIRAGLLQHQPLLPCASSSPSAPTLYLPPHIIESHANIQPLVQTLAHTYRASACHCTRTQNATSAFCSAGVDKGFVAQTADVVYGRLVPLSPIQQQAANTTIPLEVTPDVVHEEGTLSIGRHEDPNSGGSSFSILYGRQQHLDMQYTIFGYVSTMPPSLDSNSVYIATLLC
jgi:Cyclophilin type peptidyl-prolyl cis-trans isomerase/CLD